MAVTNPDAPPHMRASMIIVPTDTPGFNLVRNIPVMGHSGDDYFSHGEILYQSWIAESAAEIRAARLMVLHTAWTIENKGSRRLAKTFL